MINENGFRLNVGIVLVDANDKVFWGRRAAKSNGWQFPQGGIEQDEEPIDAMYRELHEEVGLHREDVHIIAESQQWLDYRLPKRYLRHYSQPLVVGQTQRWFLLRLQSDQDKIQLDATGAPEFLDYVWVDFWYPLRNIISFKRRVYQSMLTEFEPLLLKAGN